MFIFLTGGTGFIGQPLTRTLLARGYNVRALVRNPNSLQAQALQRMGAELCAGDINARDSMRAAMHGAEMVIHNAGHYEYGVTAVSKARMRQINVTGTENVLGLAHELGISRTLYVSSVAALGNSGEQTRDESFTRQAPCFTAYEQSKTDAHAVALTYQARGLPLIILCPHAVVGVGDHSAWGYFARLYVNHIMPPIAWSPDAVSGCVAREDLAEGIALAAEKGRLGELYIFAGERQSLREIMSIWNRTHGAFRIRLWLSKSMAFWLFAPLEPLQRLLGIPAFLSRETVLAAAGNFDYSSQKAKDELGWSHRSGEAMWQETLEAERTLLSKRNGQGLLARLKPWVER